jgi:hypothetical protein
LLPPGSSRGIVLALNSKNGDFLGNLGAIEGLQEVFCTDKFGHIVTIDYFESTILATNLLNPNMKILVERLVTNSKCTTQYTAQVNSKLHNFFSSISYRGPAKSTPVTSKTKASWTLSSGNGYELF